MKVASTISRKFCFISDSNQSYFEDYIDLSQFDNNLDYSFEDVNMNELNAFNPHIIIIDQYFYEKDCSILIETLKSNFSEANIYFLSPEYANYNGIFQSLEHKNHYYSNFSVDILNHINGVSQEKYLEVI